MHWDTFQQDNYNTVGGDGGCRVGKVRAGTTSPMPDRKGFKLQQLSEIHLLHFLVNCQKFSTLRVNIGFVYDNGIHRQFRFMPNMEVHSEAIIDKRRPQQVYKHKQSYMINRRIHAL